MWPKIKQFIKKHVERVQKSDDRTKKRGGIGSSAATMLVVIGLWLMYMNFMIKNVGQVEQTENQSPPANSSTFWQVFKTGLKVVGGSIKEQFKQITEEREIIIEK